MKGVVTKSTGSLYLVKIENKILKCSVRGAFRMRGVKTTNPVAVGDWVDIHIEPTGDVGVISNVCERNNYIIRKSTNLSRQGHIIAANIDQAFLVATLAMPGTSTIFMDRFLMTAESYNITTQIVFNKIDLYGDTMRNELQELRTIYENIGYNCIETSATKNINLDQLKELMKNKVSVFSGNSGVGKSSLINALDPDLNLRVDAISNYHSKGKHTTTFTEMFDLEFGGSIIDTPGIKGFGIIDVRQDKQISHYFPEMFRLLEQCKLHNCTHIHEPECAVKKAVKKGIVSQSRYMSYVTILLDEDTKYRA